MWTVFSSLAHTSERWWRGGETEREPVTWETILLIILALGKMDSEMGRYMRIMGTWEQEWEGAWGLWEDGNRNGKVHGTCGKMGTGMGCTYVIACYCSGSALSWTNPSAHDVSHSFALE